MARPAIDQISQTELIYELRRWIDAARFSVYPAYGPSYQAACAQVVDLVANNPISCLRSHVLHNLGQRRRLWLRQFAATLPAALVTKRVIEKMGADG